MRVTRWIILGCLFLLLIGGIFIRPALRTDTVTQPEFRTTVSPSVPEPTPVSTSDSSAVRITPAHSETLTTDSGTVLFNGMSFATQDHAGEELQRMQNQLAADEWCIGLLAFSYIPTPAQRQDLEHSGIYLKSYLADKGWIARIQTNPSGRTPDTLTLFQELLPEFKISPWLQHAEFTEDVPLYIHLLSGETGRDVDNALHHEGFEDLSIHDAGGFRYLAGRVPPEDLPRLLALVSTQNEVQFIEAGTSASLMNNTSAKILQSGSYTGTTPIFAQGIYGSNQILAVLDTGLDVDSCYFRDTNGTLPPTNRITGTNVNLSLRKVVACDFLYAGDNPAVSTHWDNQGHGTRVAGHALGSKITDPLGTSALNGMAPAAKLVVQDGGFTTWDNCSDLVGLGCPVTNFYPALLQAVAQGVTLHNNSWGDRENYSPQNLYTEPCRELDLITWSNKEFLVVCAAGNGGPGINTVGSPSVAKNSLSVGASINGSSQESLANFSSRGWASDGRYKPDLCAPGQSVTSSTSDKNITTQNCGTGTGNGTSYSSPMVMGLAALVRDYFAQGFYPGGAADISNELHTASAALVKAVLINCSEHMLNATAYPPSRDQGWGRVNLSNALAFTNSSFKLFANDHLPIFDATPALPFRTYLNIHSTNVPVKVTLVWSDYPATAGSSKQLINDLDLRVTTAADVDYKGNVFGAGGLSAAGGSFDRTNNVEQVYYQPTTTGIVEISVWAYAVPAATQDFAVVATGDLSSYPVDRDDDSDGLPDYWELKHFGNLSPLPDDDPDSDKATNLQEAGANTDPNHIADVFRLFIDDMTNDEVNIIFGHKEGRKYQIEYANLLNPTGLTSYSLFNNQQEGVGRYTAGNPGVTGLVTFIDDFTSNTSGGSNAPRRLYRVNVSD